jgi:hypothetical protein
VALLKHVKGVEVTSKMRVLCQEHTKARGPLFPPEITTAQHIQSVSQPRSCAGLLF